MKKVWLVIISFAMSLICMACTNLGDYTAVVELSNPKEKLALQVLNCFEEKDKEALKKLFCNVSKESDTLDDEIQIAMEFIDGEIESYNENIVGGEQTSYEDGKIRKQSLDAYMQNIETNSGYI